METLRRVERLEPVLQEATEPVHTSWNERLFANLDSLSEASRQVLAKDSELLAEMVAPRDGDQVSVSSWPESRVRTGIVVGAVQSGKTASMLALCARLLDRGVGAVIILAGTRIALWLQTYERVLAQLDGSTIASAFQRNQERALVPDPNDILNGEQRVEAASYLSTKRNAMRKAAEHGKPIVFVIPKQDDHLLHLARAIEGIFATTGFVSREQPFELVVLDDEADDASVLDACESEKITPRFIRDLWAGRSAHGATLHRCLYATYVAYTATPQANFLQATHNPLAPRDFQAVLRVPAAEGTIDPRGLTYREERGLHGYYTGGHYYYELLRARPGDPCRAYTPPSRVAGDGDTVHEARVEDHRWELLGDALRAYLVAAAIRIHFSGRRYSGLSTGGLDELSNSLPAVHSMLFHPSALRDKQFEGAQAVARWCAAVPGREGATTPPVDSRGEPMLSVEGLKNRLRREEQAWKSWVDDYQHTVDALRMQRGGQALPELRGVPWSTLRALLEEEIFPHVRLRVLNSDPRADERPLFQPVLSATTGQYEPPPDLLSIFIAGNVLSRGLTIEGLSTSLFLRSSNEPAADTQMQMQRWFGFRGKYLPFCRLFAYADQIALFRAYHTADEALKTSILNHMEQPNGRAGHGLVLQGAAFLATSKVDSRRVPLHPGPTPSVKLVEHQNLLIADANLAHCAREWGRRSWQALVSGDGRQRGFICPEPLGLLEVAVFLEGLRYSHHNPNPTDELVARWTPLASSVAVERLIHLPGGVPQPSRVGPNGCPYAIAAYLRLWSALLARPNTPGFYPTDRPDLPWNMQAGGGNQPMFYFGFRGGSAGSALLPELAEAGVTSMKRELDHSACAVETLWGSRGTKGQYYGDQLFDYHLHATVPIPSLQGQSPWRPRGHPGLILIHLIRHPTAELDMVAVGLALPHGGPDHIAALRLD